MSAGSERNDAQMIPFDSGSNQDPGGGLVVSVLAFNSKNLSLNTAGYLNVPYENTKINLKRPWLAHL